MSDTIEFYYDFSSPYTYLAATQIDAVAARHGARVAWKPFLLGALFKSIGTPIAPLFEVSEAKRRYFMKDMLDWSAHWGVPFRFPSRFPMRTVLPLRAALAVGEDRRPAVSRAIFRAYWAEDQDIADPAVLAPLVGDDAALERAQNDPALKQALIELTREAEQVGTCGAPAFVVRGHLFWGQDRFELIERVLDGWDPPRA